MIYTKLPAVMPPVWYKTQHRLAGYAMRIHTHLHFGRLQSHVRLMPDALVLRSKIDSDNRFLPYYDVPEYAAYQPHAYGFIPYPAA